MCHVSLVLTLLHIHKHNIIMGKASHLAVVPRCGTRGTYLSMMDCRGRCGLETSPCRWDVNSVVEFLRFFGSPIPAVRAISWHIYLSIYTLFLLKLKIIQADCHSATIGGDAQLVCDTGCQ